MGPPGNKDCFNIDFICIFSALAHSSTNHPLSLLVAVPGPDPRTRMYVVNMYMWDGNQLQTAAAAIADADPTCKPGLTNHFHNRQRRI
jgi:hypothetical protein